MGGICRVDKGKFKRHADVLRVDLDWASSPNTLAHRGH